MDLKKLFSVQKELRNRINYKESDRFDKLILALLVEVGECAQEWRGFKFWSKDQEPRTKIKCRLCNGSKEIFSPYPEFDTIECPHCDGLGIEKPGNPLLEEYVDGLHLILDIGIHLECHYETYQYASNGHTPLIAFKDVYYYVTELDVGRLEDNQDHYEDLFESYLELGESLGFTFAEIEAAYYEKNKINHDRQDSGTY